MIRYTDEGLVTDETEIVVLFLGEKGLDYRLLAIESDREWPEFVIEYYDGINCAEESITIPWYLVRKKLEPVEGAAIFYWYDPDNDHTTKGVLYQAAATREVINVSVATVVASNGLTLGKNAGELRELLEWSKKEK